MRVNLQILSDKPMGNFSHIRNNHNTAPPVPDAYILQQNKHKSIPKSIYAIFVQYIDIFVHFTYNIINTRKEVILCLKHLPATSVSAWIAN